MERSAQSVSIVDYASTIAKVNAENEAMKEQMETMKKNQFQKRKKLTDSDFNNSQDTKGGN